MKYYDGVQGTLPQNMTSCHIEYFKLEEYKKTAEAVFCPATGHTIFMRGTLPTPRGKEHSRL